MAFKTSWSLRVDSVVTARAILAVTTVLVGITVTTFAVSAVKFCVVCGTCWCLVTSQACYAVESPKYFPIAAATVLTNRAIL
jgi:hypothetical protein